jgi:hypothetical protein
VNTQELRDFVRAHLEVDDEELPDTILNVYLQDAFERTMAMDNRWPRNEQTFSVSKVAGADAATLPPTLSVPTIMSVTSVANGYRLPVMNHENMEDTFVPNYTVGGGQPVYVSIWAGQMYFWPKVNTDDSYDVNVRAYAQPAWDSNASAIPDLDSRLHIALAYYAMSLVYAAQEDEVLEGVYMARWNRDVTQTLKSIMEPVHSHPLVLHGGNPAGGWPSFVVNLPDTP